MRLKIENICKQYGSNLVLDNISFDFKSLYSCVIVGPSGGGKTTLLNILAGLETPSSGKVLVDGNIINYNEKELNDYRKTVGTVFQSYNLFPHLSAMDNVVLPLTKVHHLHKDEAVERANDLFRSFGLLEHKNKKSAELSGGQQQRVAIIRALAKQPRFFLLDEPTSALDPGYVADVLDMILELRKQGRRLIIVTHQMNFAQKAAEYLIFMKNGAIVTHGVTADLFDENNSNNILQFSGKLD